ncbi:PadR family transcriptional regulator [Pelagicoccus sp. NFK12]|uniref:PadR family transcriptional regulator n=1 Tax=Pelagicoccus enzymogenes TaxID=2773457 RepID=A0A927F978_9BACT|nr:PadR family transcriptional regulator [Pelagicoccus enzymogenes]MBD5780818.1 PadR family transcriptional regulator [Pelagicoccus enzymogenes]MDQ8200496.1 PadR family transcriptional regulator [Pelagicoccus enzymogenes]
MDKGSKNLLQGTLDLLILRALRDEERHGWGIQQRINQIGEEALMVNQGSLYPALVRLGTQGFLETEWRVTENGRRAKYYRLTAAGRKRLEEETEQWRRYSRVVNLILETI